MLKAFRTTIVLITLVAVLATSIGTGLASPDGVTTRVSVSSAGTQGNGSSGFNRISISGDGRLVVFPSRASFVSGCSLFVHDRDSGQTNCVSIAVDGTPSWGGNLPAISADGRYVAFYSMASNLIPGDTNNICDMNGDGIYDENCSDVFIYDRFAGQTMRVSVASDDSQGDGISGEGGVDISADGRYVVFSSEASNLVPGDTNNYCYFKDGTPGANCPDVFIHDTQTGVTTRISVASDGTEGNQGSYSESISADGRYVAFASIANNLVLNDTNGHWDVFVHDRLTGQTTRVSIASSGVQGNRSSGGYINDLSMSANGRYVAFASNAYNLVSGDTNGEIDVFVHDLQTGQTTRVSVSSNGMEGNGMSGLFGVDISADGSYVAFYSEASNLVSGDTNGTSDVFVHDRKSGQTTRVSVASDGTEGNDWGSWFPAISDDGSIVAFVSGSSNLVPGDTNGDSDVFVHDRSPVAGPSDAQLISAPVVESAVPLSKRFGNSILTVYPDALAIWKPLGIASTLFCFASALTPVAPVTIPGCVVTTLKVTLIWFLVKEGAEKLAEDPPTEDFEQVFQLEPIVPFDPMDDSPFGRAWADFMTSLAEYTALLEAYRITLERLTGAIAADEVPFIILQAEALKEFTDLMEDNQEEMQVFVEALSQEFAAVCDSELEGELTRLATEGLSEEERQLLEDEGVAPEDIQAIEEIFPDVVPGGNYCELVEQGLEDWTLLIDDTLQTLDEISTIIRDVINELNARTPKSHGYWPNHPDAIQPLLSLTLGDEVVDTVPLAQEILDDANASDASKALAAHLLATQLNVNSEALEQACILPVVAEAQEFMTQYPRDSGLTAKNKAVRAIRNEALALKDQLDDYNNTSGPCFD